MSHHSNFVMKPSTLETGSTKYHIGQLIGEGTYSKVCLASRRYGSHKKVVACKIINKRHIGSDFNTKFLPRELSIMRMICHPNIVTLVDILEFRSHVYVFMDYCKYGDLLDHIRYRGRLSERRSKCLFRQIALAVEYLHDLNVAHRDLKCENILLSDKNVVKLGDFGFARLCVNVNSGKEVLSKTFCGSAAYAAPEIIQGCPYNPKMYDIWSIGCILYIMLTAEMPFDETDMTKMLKFQQNRLIRHSIRQNENISHAAKTLLKLLLEPNVSNRAKIGEVVLCKWLTDAKIFPNDVGRYHYNFRYF